MVDDCWEKNIKCYKDTLFCCNALCIRDKCKESHTNLGGHCQVLVLLENKLVLLSLWLLEIPLCVENTCLVVTSR